MVFAAVLAGGTGRRMQTENELPKQFLPLNNKPVLVYSLECFLKCPDIDKIYLANGKDEKLIWEKPKTTEAE